MLRPINLPSVILIIAWGLGGVSQVMAQAPSTADHHTTNSTAPDHPAAAVYNHSVKLSWGRSVPATKSPRDAVVGYNVYRSGTSHDHNPKRLNSKPWANTTYTDTEVEAGKIYFYVTRGVTAQGVESRGSNEVRVEMPPK